MLQAYGACRADGPVIQTFTECQQKALYFQHTAVSGPVSCWRIGLRSTQPQDKHQLVCFWWRELRTRMSLVKPSVATTVEGKQTEQKLHHDKSPNLREFYPGEQVLVKDFRVEGTWHRRYFYLRERTAPIVPSIVSHGLEWPCLEAPYLIRCEGHDVNLSSTRNEQFHHRASRMADDVHLRRNDNQRYGEQSRTRDISAITALDGDENSETVQTENERLESNSGESTPQADQQPRRSGRMRRELSDVLIAEM